ncbi:MAG: acyl-CoA thioesterase [Candidatus Phaeomarinobacter sp.]
MTFWSPEPYTKPAGGDAAFRMTALPQACVGPDEHQFFMGGLAMAAAVEALERTTGKPLLWATIQFLSHGFLDDEIDIDAKTVGGGRNVTQMMATLSKGDVVLQRVIGALGERPNGRGDVFVSMPDVPPPGGCAPKADDAFGRPDNLLAQFERRTAIEDNDRGLECMWMRPLFDAEVNAPLLALMSDFFLGAHPATRGGTSLDNTLRVHATVPSEWVLCVTQFAGFVRGAVHGSQHMFSQDGVLLTSSSQTGLLPNSRKA